MKRFLLCTAAYLTFASASFALPISLNDAQLAQVVAGDSNNNGNGNGNSNSDNGTGTGNKL
jgi:hypothetical protein